MANNDNHPIRDKRTWLRIVFLTLFGIVLYFVKYLILLVGLLMAIISLFKRTPNEQLQNFGSGLAEYAWQITRYLSYNTQTKPFPFDDWKQGSKPEANRAATDTTKTRATKTSKPASKAKSTTTKTAAAKSATARSRSNAQKGSSASSSTATSN